MKKWAGTGYGKWIVQSLWIKSLYIRNLKIDKESVEWLKEFPPRMNRGRFLNYAYMLYWVLLRSGLRFESESFINRLYGEYGIFEDVKKLQELAQKKSSIYNNAQYRYMRLRYTTKESLKNLMLEFSSLGNA